MGKIKEKLRNLEIRLIGNRANALGIVLLATTFTYMANQFHLENYSSRTDQSIYVIIKS